MGLSKCMEISRRSSLVLRSLCIVQPADYAGENEKFFMRDRKAHVLPLGGTLVKVRVIRTGLRMTCSLDLEESLHQP